MLSWVQKEYVELLDNNISQYLHWLSNKFCKHLTCTWFSFFSFPTSHPLGILNIQLFWLSYSFGLVYNIIECFLISAFGFILSSGKSVALLSLFWFPGPLHSKYVMIIVWYFSSKLNYCFFKLQCIF